MKVTSFKAVETYLYSSVVIPLKGMNVRPLDCPSPIFSNNGKRAWEFRVQAEPLRRSYRRQYQREQALAQANQQVVLWTGKNEYVVATYNTRHHWVKVYERPFRILKATPLLGKLYEVFQTNTPFGKVISELDPPVQGVYRNRDGDMRMPQEAPDQPDYDEDEYDEERPF